MDYIKELLDKGFILLELDEEIGRLDPVNTFDADLYTKNHGGHDAEEYKLAVKQKSEIIDWFRHQLIKNEYLLINDALSPILRLSTPAFHIRHSTMSKYFENLVHSEEIIQIDI